MSPLFPVMSLTVSDLAANEMAAMVSMNTPALTHVCDEGGKTYPARDELIWPGGLAADHVEHRA